NEFNDLRDFAIQFLCYKNSTIRNNEFYNCTGGIICYSSNPDNENHILDIYNHVTSTVQPCINITIESNWFNRISGKQIIYCYGREKSKNNNFKIIDNKIDNSLDVRGVIISTHSNHIEINNNIIDNVGNFPISVRDGSWVTINNNDITNSLTHTAIRAVEKIRYLHITNNKIFKTGGNAINVFNDVFSIVITGNICLGANGLDEDYHSIYVHSDGGKIITSNNVIRKLTDFVYGSA